MNCIFCRIISGEAPGTILFRDELVTAFRDAHPKASTHILVTPNRHISSVNELDEEDAALVGHMILVAKAIAKNEGVAKNGYRIIINTGPDAGQSVFHLHLHLIAGKHAWFTMV